MIRVENLTVAYDLKTVLSDINLEIKDNVIAAIIGPNGAGKSTLLKAILGFIKPITGNIKIFGKDLNEVRQKIAYVPQQASVNWDFPISVYAVVFMGRYKGFSFFNKNLGVDKEKTVQALREMGLYDLKDRQISELSGGQKQRVFIARALCQDSELIIMDEPLAGVDKTSEKIIMDKIKELKKQGKTIVCVHHDLNTLKEYFDFIILLNNSLTAYGDTAAVFTKENLDRTYI